jgi:hypothetical protein
MSVMLLGVFLVVTGNQISVGKTEYKGLMLPDVCTVTAQNLNQAAANDMSAVGADARFHYYCLAR